MEFGGKYLLKAPRLAVWHALNDTEVLMRTIPGCTRIAWTGEHSLDLSLAVNLGVAHPVFEGTLELSNVLAATSYTLEGRGKGGLLGRIHGAADVTLADAGPDTLLRFEAQGKASKTLLRLGKPVIGRSAQAVIDGFFGRFADAMGVAITSLTPNGE